MRRARGERREGTGERGRQPDRDEQQPSSSVRGLRTHLDGTSLCGLTIAVVAAMYVVRLLTEETG